MQAQVRELAHSSWAGIPRWLRQPVKQGRGSRAGPIVKGIGNVVFKTDKLVTSQIADIM